MSNFRELEDLVIEWSKARKIIPHSTPCAQSRKNLEEAGELLEATAALKALRDVMAMTPSLANNQAFFMYYAATLDAVMDALGDNLVTLINVAALADLDLVKALQSAYNVIKDRKGTLRADGVFVKEP